jgi:hypothetical protein
LSEDKEVQIKEAIRQLHDGVLPEQVKEKFRAVFEGSAREIPVCSMLWTIESGFNSLTKCLNSSYLPTRYILSLMLTACFALLFRLPALFLPFEYSLNYP